jgi:hypothetical protein
MAEVEIPHAEGKQGEKVVGILIAVIAVLMAVIGSLGNNAANDMIVNEVKSSNSYAWYQAKRQREYLNDLELKRIEVELAGNPTAAQREGWTRLANELRAKNAEYRTENEKIQAEARQQGLEARTAGARNDAFDHAEILFQVAVVLCSLTLLTESRLFLRLGLVVAVAGLVMGGRAFFQQAPAEGGGSTSPAAAASR